jgi:hypothetical protein
VKSLHRLTWRNAAWIFLSVVIANASLSSARAQLSHTPRAGSTERKEILDAIRAACESDLQQRVVFTVELLNVAGDWAAARVTPMRPDGSAIDYSRTRYREDNDEGVFDGEGEALLRRKGGTWTLVKWRFGASDTELSLWIEELGAPKSLEHSD